MLKLVISAFVAVQSFLRLHFLSDGCRKNFGQLFFDLFWKSSLVDLVQLLKLCIALLYHEADLFSFLDFALQ